MKAKKLKLNSERWWFCWWDQLQSPLKAHAHSLEVLLSSALHLYVWVVEVARSTYYQLCLVHQLCPFLGQKELTTVAHSLVIQARLL